MTWYSSKDVSHCFLGLGSVAPYLNTVRLKTSATLTDTTGLGDTWREMSDTGLRTGELEFSGFYDGTSHGAYLNTVSDSDSVVSLFLEGNTAGKRFYGWRAATVSSAEIGLSSDSVHTSAPGINVRGAVDFGYLVATYADRTTAGNTDATYVDLGASAASGRAYMRIGTPTLGGYDNIIVTVRHCDTSDGTYEDHTSFPAVTTATHSTLALATTINRYVSISWAWTGAGTGQSATFFVGVAPV